MTGIQEDKLSMFYGVKGTCEKYQSTWTTNALFAATYNIWAAKLPLIEQNRDAQTIETTGVTTDKKGKRAVMTEKTLFMSNRLQSFGNTTGNAEILESVQYSASYLNKARDTDVIGICNAVLSRATEQIFAIFNIAIFRFIWLIHLCFNNLVIECIPIICD